jgi:hypothetical protein
MRTTLTLEDDVAAGVQRLMRRRGGSLKDIVNEALRRGLEVLERRPGPAAKPYRAAPWNLGGSLVGSLDNVEEILSRAEGEDHR